MSASPAPKPTGKPDRMVASKWTSVLAERGFTAVSNDFLELYHQLEITPTEAMLIVHLMRYKWDKRAPYPSFGALARAMGITVPAARAIARRLDKKGIVRRVARNGETNEFDLTLLFAKLEALVSAKGAEK